MRFIACLLLVVAAACGGDSPTEPTPASVAGTWRLQTVNGSVLPFLLVEFGTDKVELTSDVLIVAASGSFAQMKQLTTTQSGQVSTDDLTDAGTYTLNGTAVTFTFDSDSSTGTGSLSGNTLTVAGGSFAMVYRKQ